MRGGDFDRRCCMTSSEKDKKKFIAEESLKTRRAREKLKKQLEALDQRVTPQALERKVIEIQRWISRHASHRIALKNKSISLFDENQNAAALSMRVSQLADQIKTEFRSSNNEDPV